MLRPEIYDAAYDDWYNAALDKGYQIKSFNKCSKRAYDNEGLIRGEWLANMDSDRSPGYESAPIGWLLAEK